MFWTFFCVFQVNEYHINGYAQQCGASGVQYEYNQNIIGECKGVRKPSLSKRCGLSAVEGQLAERITKPWQRNEKWKPEYAGYIEDGRKCMQNDQFSWPLQRPRLVDVAAQIPRKHSILPLNLCLFVYPLPFVKYNS